MLLWGHSLGTGIAAHLALEQQRRQLCCTRHKRSAQRARCTRHKRRAHSPLPLPCRGEPVRGIVLEAAYLSLRIVSSSFPGTLAVRMLPFGYQLIRRFFAYDFPTNQVREESTTWIAAIHTLKRLHTLDSRYSSALDTWPTVC